MSGKQPKQRLAPAKRLLGLLLLGLIIVVSMVGGFWASGGFAREEPGAMEGFAHQLLFVIVMAVFGAMALAGGVLAYAIVYYTNGLTSDFTRPFFASFKPRLYFANVFVGLLFILGIALLIGAFATPILANLGLGSTLSFLLPLGCTLIIMQFVLMWLQIWSPLERRVIARRLSALGITPEQIESGIPIGISDPTQSSFRKMTLVEDDLGMLWIAPNLLIYRGDTDHFDIPRDRFIAMERKADAGSTSAYAGAVHIILRFFTPDGRERQVRLHTEGCPTLSRKARSLDELAGRLQDWVDQSGSVPAAEIEVLAMPPEGNQ
jgi:hypothetical protein